MRDLSLSFHLLSSSKPLTLIRHLQKGEIHKILGTQIVTPFCYIVFWGSLIDVPSHSNGYRHPENDRAHQDISMI